MGTTTLLSLDQKLLENIGDWLQHPVTTAIAASTSIVSTHLQNYRSTADAFNDYWIYIEDKANIDVVRRISDDDGTSTLTVLGSNLLTDGANLATFRLNRWGSQTQRELALNEAIEEVYPNLHLPLEDRTLVTGNILPNSHFEDWATSSNPTHWPATNVTAAKETTIIRGGATSAKVTRAGVDGQISLKSVSGGEGPQWPRVLDLMGKTVTFKCWACATTASQAYIEIYTEQADGTTTQTLTSSAHSGDGEWELLELENQVLNDDLTQLTFRCAVRTSDGAVYFDNARCSIDEINEYCLPNNFYNGSINQVYVQTSGLADDPCDDLSPQRWERIFGYDIYHKSVKGTQYRFLQLPYKYSNPYQIRILGNKALESLSASTDTITLDGQDVNLLIEYASYRLFKILQGGIKSTDREMFEEKAIRHLAEYYRFLRTHSMPRKSSTMKLPV